MLPNFAYSRPESIKDAVSMAATENARIYAGGTDLLGCLRDGVFGAETVVSISGLKDLRKIHGLRDGKISIGALATITEVAESEILKEHYPGLAQGAGEVASPQLRNQGTIGGNICQKPRCWYYRGDFDCLRKGGDICFAVGAENRYHCIFGGNHCFIVHPSDTAPNLVAAGAEIEVVGPEGSRSIAAENFWVPPESDPQRETFLEPGEIVTQIVLPAPKKGMKSSYRKIRARRSWDFALAGVALAIVFEGNKVAHARVVFSGVAPIPWRSHAVEKVITGNRLSADIIQKAAEVSVEGAKPLGQNEYKIPLLKAAVVEELSRIG